MPKDWSTSYKGKNPVQDPDPITDAQENLNDDPYATDPPANRGDRFRVSHILTLRDKLDTLAKVVGDKNDLPSGSLKERITTLESLIDDYLLYNVVHTDNNNEINSLILKPLPQDEDVLIIEDSDDNWNKKKIKINDIVYPALPLTTKGDILTYDTEDQRLPIGNNGQVLTVDNTTDTGLKWEDQIEEYISPLATKGDIFTYDTEDQRLPVGTNGQILTVDNTTDTGLKWKDLESPLTTKGDILTYDTEDQRLPVGDNGQILTVNNATDTGLEWTDLQIVAISDNIPRLRADLFDSPSFVYESFPFKSTSLRVTLSDGIQYTATSPINMNINNIGLGGRDSVQSILTPAIATVPTNPNWDAEVIGAELTPQGDLRVHNTTPDGNFVPFTSDMLGCNLLCRAYSEDRDHYGDYSGLFLGKITLVSDQYYLNIENYYLHRLILSCSFSCPFGEYRIRNWFVGGKCYYCYAVIDNPATKTFGIVISINSPDIGPFGYSIWKYLGSVQTYYNNFVSRVIQINYNTFNNIQPCAQPIMGFMAGNFYGASYSFTYYDKDLDLSRLLSSENNYMLPVSLEHYLPKTISYCDLDFYASNCIDSSDSSEWSYARHHIFNSPVQNKHSLIMNITQKKTGISFGNEDMYNLKVNIPSYLGYNVERYIYLRSLLTTTSSFAYYNYRLTWNSYIDGLL